MARRSYYVALFCSLLIGVGPPLAASQTSRTSQVAAQQTARADTDTWSEMIERGYDVMAAGDYVGAEKKFREALGFAEQHNLGTASLADSHEAVGASLRAQRRYAESEGSYRTALQMARSIYPEDSEEVAGVKAGLGMALVGLSQYEEAERILLESLDAYNKQPKVTACVLSFPLDALTMLYKSHHQYSKGKRIYTEAFALLTGKRGTPCENFALMLDHLAQLYADNSQWDYVEKIQQGRVDLTLGMEGPHSEHYADALYALGDTLQTRHHWEDAAAAYAHAAEIYRHTDPPSFSKLGYSLERQEMSLYSAGKPDEAKRVHQALLAVNKTSDPDAARGEMMSLHSRVVEAQKNGNLDAAGQLVARELTVSQKLNASDQMIALGDSAMVHEAQHRISEAEADRKRILALSIATTGPTSRATADADYWLGWFYTKHHRLSEAEQSYAAALSLYGPHDGDRVKLTLVLLGRAYLAEQKFDQAVPVFERAVKLAEDTHDGLQLSVALENLGEVYHKANRLPEAEAALTHAMNTAQELPKPMNRQWIGAALASASFYRETGRSPQAEQLYLRTIAFVEKELGPAAPTLRLPLDGLIGLLRSEGRLAEAAKYEARRDQLPPMPKLPGTPD